jgi:hypothetical protein
MSKYTPGPWVYRPGEQNDIESVQGLPVLDLGCGCCSCHSTTEYDLILMAAAPDLLRYLELAVDTIKGEYPEEQWPDYKVPEMEKLIKQVKS